MYICRWILIFIDLYEYVYVSSWTLLVQIAIVLEAFKIMHTHTCAHTHTRHSARAVSCY